MKLLHIVEEEVPGQVMTGLGDCRVGMEVVRHPQVLNQLLNIDQSFVFKLVFHLLSPLLW